MDYDTDRSRGILSPADRAFLLGETEMSHEQSKRNAEARIRERVTNAVLDFDLLVHHCRKKDRRQVFDNAADDPRFMDGVAAMLGFAYMGTKESGIDFEHALEPAIRKSEEVYAADVFGSTVDVTVEFDVETELGTAVDDVARKIEVGEAVTPAELFSLVVTDADALSDAESIMLWTELDGLPGDGFVDRIASFLDATVIDSSGGRVELVL